ncbi:hypothetical protein PENSPDRAFT_327628 [Peniophora sp. CONT]|nr:hypothetical protein PENSPDRAFT_327628 [Peniophora sp. CONT]
MDIHSGIMSMALCRTKKTHAKTPTFMAPRHMAQAKLPSAARRSLRPTSCGLCLGVLRASVSVSTAPTAHRMRSLLSSLAICLKVKFRDCSPLPVVAGSPSRVVAGSSLQSRRRSLGEGGRSRSTSLLWPKTIPRAFTDECLFCVYLLDYERQTARRRSRCSVSFRVCGFGSDVYACICIHFWLSVRLVSLSPWVLLIRTFRF